MVRIGSSIDIHAFCENKKLMLGGVEIDYEFGLKGHSDADVVLHSVCEAIIGALGLGDIGEHFPDDDPQYKGIASSILLKNVVSLMNEYDYMIGNVDLTILCEQPYLKNYKSQIKSNIAMLLNTNQYNINVKGGKGESYALVLRERK